MGAQHGLVSFPLLQQVKVTTSTNCTKPRNFFPLQVELGDGPEEAAVHSGWKLPAPSASSLHLVGSGSLLWGEIKTMRWGGLRGEVSAKTFKR